jgi:hypothetical protein
MHRLGWETQGLEAGATENLIAMGVVSGLFQSFVMRTVNLNDEPAAQTDEVWIVTEQRGLPPEVEAFGP